MQLLIVLAIHHHPNRFAEVLQFSGGLCKHRHEVAVQVNHKLDRLGILAHAMQHQWRGRLLNHGHGVIGKAAGVVEVAFNGFEHQNEAGPTEGSVLVDGQELTTLSESELTKARRQIGMIFQHFNLLSSRTVFGNVALPLELDNTPKDEVKRRVTELLSLVGLGDKHDSYPSNLSGGQKQRVAIARALASNPKVLLCDEATSALDPATTRSILELLKDINRRLGLTILLITHEMDVVKRICDCVAVISNGELIEQDTVSEVFSHPKTPLAQKFIQSTLHLDIPEDYQERLQAEPFTDCVPMLRLEFTGQSVDAPLPGTAGTVPGDVSRSGRAQRRTDRQMAGVWFLPRGHEYRQHVDSGHHLRLRPVCLSG